MKTNLFRLFILACFNLMLGHLAQASSLPRFSTSTTEGETTWYFISFNAGSFNLHDGGNNIRVRTRQADTSSKNQKWALVGTKDDFVLYSLAGRYLSYSDDLKLYTCSREASVHFRVVESSEDPDAFEIQRIGGTAGQSMQMTSPGTVNTTVRDSVAGTEGALITFKPCETLTPIFVSETEEPVWYIVAFCHNAQTAISARGNNESIVQAKQSKSNAGLWKFIGNKDNFKIANKDGKYLYTQASGNLVLVMASTDASKAGSFKLTASTNTTYKGIWMIESLSNSGSYLNAQGGVTVGNGVCLWNNASDTNNPLNFIEETMFEASEYIVSGVTGYVPEEASTMWYTTPAVLAPALSGDVWKDYALPLGNGQLGTTYLGGIYKEDLQFNEKTLWTGRSTDNTTGGSKYTAGNGGYGGYQNFGNIIVQNIDKQTIDFADGKDVTEYVRTLNLATGVGGVDFKNSDGNIAYERRYLVSNPDNVGAYLFTANAPGKQSLRITVNSGKPGVNATTSYSDGMATFAGKLETVSYQAAVKVVNKGGTLRTRGSYIDVVNADSVIIFMAAGTDYDPQSTTYVSTTLRNNLKSEMSGRVNAAAEKSWNEIYEAHVADHSKYFGRVEFVIDAARNNKPTNELIDDYTNKRGTADAGALMLEKLYFDYGRYMTIAGSRGIDLPTNLQGIWNNSSNAPWGADIHANINVQMNYWPAEPTNLSELHLPFLNYIINMANSKEWKANATQLAGQTKGWTCITENNIFGGRGNFQTNYVIANAWYVTHLWQHYRYTLDRDFLKRAFPAMWGATQFWMERLILASDGTYECPNEYSPEHGPGSQNAVAHAQQLVAELFANTLAAANILGSDANISQADLNTLNDRYSKLDKGLAIEKYTGAWGHTKNGISTGTNILREWKYSDYTAGADGHRHSSHLMCLYPFSQVTQGSALFNAAVNSLQLRGDASTGWSMGWKVNLWARAKDGNHAHQIFNYALIPGRGNGGVFYNLFDVHAPYYFQIDGNFGTCSGIAEMLMQSHTDTIEILPALPTTLWRSGHIKGLKAVGDFTVDISWKNAKADQIKIKSNQGQPLVVKSKDIANATAIYVGSNLVTATKKGNDIVSIPCEAGQTVNIFMNTVPTGFKKATLTETATPKLHISQRTITVSGEVQTLELLDLQGRTLKRAKGNSLSAAQGQGSLFLLKITMKNGQSKTIKVSL